MNIMQKRCTKVLENLIKQVSEDDELAIVLTIELQILLDDLSGLDVFGTEGQMDPRGDQRDEYVYSMDFVQGVD